MLRHLCLVAVTLGLAGCPESGSHQQPQPDAPAITPDAPPPPPPPPPPPLKGYGEACTAPSQCQSGLCVGESGTFICSRPCTLDVALDCKDVDAFCVPIGNNQNACFGSIESGNDLDDAVMGIGDTVTRALTPLGDADVFEVKLDQIGKTLFEATGQASIDVQLEAYGVLGDKLGIANDTGPGQTESLQTDVQQVGTHMFMVVRNVGNSTGNYTLKVTHVATAAARPMPSEPRTHLLRLH